MRIQKKNKNVPQLTGKCLLINIFILNHQKKNLPPSLADFSKRMSPILSWCDPIMISV